MNNQRVHGNFFMVIVLVVIGLTLFFGARSARQAAARQETNYSTFLKGLEEKTVTSAVIEQSEDIPSGTVYYTVSGKQDTSYYFFTPNVNEVQDRLLEAEKAGSNVKWSVSEVAHAPDILAIISIILLVLVGLFVLFTFLRNNGMGGANAQMMNFGRSRAVMVKGNKTTFRDVAGLDEEKADLEEIVDFLKNPAKYTELGARIPKGILLVGPPGTGKTLLAKAIAGEAKVPFFSISGSDFVEMFVGVGASRVRDLFQEAKKNAPCIVFIDEIDAVARQRGSGLGGSHDEREQTLNQLLVEMDGFGINSGIIVLAATNRVDILDPAILRPGRFDRKVAVARPDIKGREAILKVHAKNKPLSDDVDLTRVAQTTAGFSGADLENLMNEAAILAAKDNREYITQHDIDQSFIKVGIGGEKRSRVISEKEKRITAYHEAGHAILFHVLPDVGPVHTISVIPTTMGAAGYTMPLPEKDEMFRTRGQLLQEIMVSLGGRIAEEITFGDVTTGASQDIKQATEAVRAMVMKYGMSHEAGLINYGGEESVFIGRDYGHTREYGEGTASILDGEIRRIMNECYDKAKSIILENQDVLKAVAESLILKEKIGQQEFESIYNTIKGISEPQPAAEEPEGE